MEITLVNGNEINCLSPADRGFQYGDGLFETIAVKGGQPEYLSSHLERLLHGCHRLGIDPPSPALLRGEIFRVCDESDKAVIKIVVTRGHGERGYRPDRSLQTTRVVTWYPWPDYPKYYRDDGILTTVCNTRLSKNPALAGIKHLNRLEQVLARGEWQDEYQEGLMLDSDDLVIEGTMSNVFLLRGDRLLTPDLSASGVDGIMRNKILECAATLGINTSICKLQLVDVYNAESLFFSNSIIGIWPVKKLGNVGYVKARLINELMVSLNLG